MDETAYYFVKIIEADQEQIRQGGRSCFDDPEDNVREMSVGCPREEGEADGRD